MTNKLKITVVGSGYVGMSLSVLLARQSSVTVLDIDPLRVDMINSKLSTVADSEIERFLSKEDLDLKATLDKSAAYLDASYIIVATPTNYDPESNCFDTSQVDCVVKDALELNNNALVVIKSTIPVGHTNKLQEKFLTSRIVFSPEFLREGNALYDNLYPSRIVIGSKCDAGKRLASLLKNGAFKDDVKTIFVSSSEAESIKLFANTYLALRVSFFNELDSYAGTYGLDATNIIEGVCLDDRIGQGYNNPSFGYGGYCLPKDTKQLLATFDRVPQALIKAVVDSNSLRKDFICSQILKSKPSVVGFCRLVMKHGSDNIRSSAILDVIERVKKQGITTLIYEPMIKEKEFNGSKVLNDIEQFKIMSEIIVTNRMLNILQDVEHKVFTRDVYCEDI
ncbi:nucleotide sugar dehydrogenase [Gammaproteobacteria bacterium]|nr:nucleotide sugar dehydrogenase [Gammaproteobacteria bacterium]